MREEVRVTEVDKGAEYNLKLSVEVDGEVVEEINTDKMVGVYITDSENTVEGEILSNVFVGGDMTLNELIAIDNSFNEGLQAFVQTLIQNMSAKMSIVELAELTEVISGGDMETIMRKLDEIIKGGK